MEQPTITFNDEDGKPVTVTLQAAWTAMVQHLIEVRRDVLALQMEVARLTTAPDKLN